jgi:uncharacterized membrane protein YdbT with pleckstrin-like domain
MTDKYLESLLGENEKIVFVARQHEVVLLWKILAKTVLAAGLAILISLIWRTWQPPLLVSLAYLLLILPLLAVLRDVISWASRKFIVTDWRVIQLSGVISKKVMDTSLEKVNDVKLEQSFVGRLLDYGDLEILTGSESGIDRFICMGQPIRFKTAMLNAKEQLAHGQALSGQRSVIDVAGPIEQLDSLRRQGLLTENEFEQQKAHVLTQR